MNRIIIFFLIIGSLFSCQPNALEPKPGNEYPTFTEDGAWCWFSDPRALFLHSEEGPKVISGWVTSQGDIQVGQLDLKTNQVSLTTLWEDFESDDHDHPAFALDKNGDVLIQYTKHGPGKIYQNRLPAHSDTFSPTQTIDPIDSVELSRFPRENITYANPFCLAAENNRCYSFGRWVGYKPSIIWSDDLGETWSKAKVVITTYPFDPGNRPYAKYYSDGRARIHILFTDGHPRVEPTNSVYYAYYEEGAFYRVDGQKICDLQDLPFTPDQASLVYQADTSKGKAWIFDITATDTGAPVIAYTRYPNDTTHLYHYATFQQGKWMDHLICNGGSWFPETPSGKTEREPNYSAGLCLHPRKPNTVFLSREINGTFEVEQWETSNFGESWNTWPLTQNSTSNNVRPYFPRNYQAGDPDLVLWMENKSYIHYTNFNSSIRYAILTTKQD